MTVPFEKPVFSDTFQPRYRPVRIKVCLNFLFGLGIINLYNINRKTVTKLFLSSQSGNVKNYKEKMKFAPNYS